MSLSRKRCFNHAGREAVARCLECENFFCRECITDHDDRLICSTCLQKLTTKETRSSALNFGALWWIIQGIAGIVIAWFFFYWIAQALLRFEDDAFQAGHISIPVSVDNDQPEVRS